MTSAGTPDRQLAHIHTHYTHLYTRVTHTCTHVLHTHVYGPHCIPLLASVGGGIMGRAVGITVTSWSTPGT